MNWLNIETTKLDSEEFVGSEPVARATWLCLFRYCAGQENGGVIVGCRDWADRKWQQLARVTKEEVLADSALWTWFGNDLHLWAYPNEKEAEVQAKREAGAKGGRSKTEAKAQASRSNGAKHNPSTTQAEPKEDPSCNPTERKGKEGKGIGKEERASPSTPRTPTLQQWLEHAAQTHADWPQSDATSAWEHYESLGWMKRKTPIQRWRSCLETCYRNWAGRNAPKIESVDEVVARMNQPIFPGYRT